MQTMFSFFGSQSGTSNTTPRLDPSTLSPAPTYLHLQSPLQLRSVPSIQVRRLSSLVPCPIADFSALGLVDWIRDNVP
ncbi:BZ3500_MvSof-1268-A1-R1_Chr2-3g05394 [Microbotryum saponariae]|uniref:BZ3500_MvSof-1268-A1-R1_Chr2-3g05394 protein n=1 Tax=Microbotryum saponariae TaxID=289078 RepID=A0A2X0LQC3_9BASI|nr:BZ3500_MvSof-1268-A1-R1_Chr2-3g05394 [Microbotryum saponariae]SDA01353.1 BZ3501_MvSof-1269-A2-R1_Chr2-2g05067 [Microbotryum saponariae]